MSILNKVTSEPKYRLGAIALLVGGYMGANMYVGGIAEKEVSKGLDKVVGAGIFKSYGDVSCGGLLSVDCSIENLKFTDEKGNITYSFSNVEISGVDTFANVDNDTKMKTLEGKSISITASGLNADGETVYDLMKKNIKSKRSDDEKSMKRELALLDQVANELGTDISLEIKASVEEKSDDMSILSLNIAASSGELTISPKFSIKVDSNSKVGQQGEAYFDAVSISGETSADLQELFYASYKADFERGKEKGWEEGELLNKKDFLVEFKKGMAKEFERSLKKQDKSMTSKLITKAEKLVDGEDKDFSVSVGFVDGANYSLQKIIVGLMMSPKKVMSALEFKVQ
jgi:flagellar biosynthesis/type III secretory pathway protein FliH